MRYYFNPGGRTVRMARVIIQDITARYVLS